MLDLQELQCAETIMLTDYNVTYRVNDVDKSETIDCNASDIFRHILSNEYPNLNVLVLKPEDSNSDIYYTEGILRHWYPTLNKNEFKTNMPNLARISHQIGDTFYTQEVDNIWQSTEAIQPIFEDDENDEPEEGVDYFYDDEDDCYYDEDGNEVDENGYKIDDNEDDYGSDETANEEPQVQLQTHQQSRKPLTVKDQILELGRKEGFQNLSDSEMACFKSYFKSAKYDFKCSPNNVILVKYGEFSNTYIGSLAQLNSKLSRDKEKLCTDFFQAMSGAFSDNYKGIPSCWCLDMIVNPQAFYDSTIAGTEILNQPMKMKEICIGKNIQGPIIVDFADESNSLVSIGGTSGSGKSSIINALMLQFIGAGAIPMFLDWKPAVSQPYENFNIKMAQCNPRLSDEENFTNACDLINLFCDICDYRKMQDDETSELCTSPVIFVFDEVKKFYNEYKACSDETQEMVEDALKRLSGTLRVCRSYAMKFFYSTQEVAYKDLFDSKKVTRDILDGCQQSIIGKGNLRTQRASTIYKDLSSSEQARINSGKGNFATTLPFKGDMTGQQHYFRGFHIEEKPTKGVKEFYTGRLLEQMVERGYTINTGSKLFSVLGGSNNETNQINSDANYIGFKNDSPSLENSELHNETNIFTNQPINSMSSPMEHIHESINQPNSNMGIQSQGVNNGQYSEPNRKVEREPNKTIALLSKKSKFKNKPSKRLDDILNDKFHTKIVEPTIPISTLFKPKFLDIEYIADKLSRKNKFGRNMQKTAIYKHSKTKRLTKQFIHTIQTNVLDLDNVYDLDLMPNAVGINNLFIAMRSFNIENIDLACVYEFDYLRTLNLGSVEILYKFLHDCRIDTIDSIFESMPYLKKVIAVDTEFINKPKQSLDSTTNKVELDELKQPSAPPSAPPFSVNQMQDNIKVIEDLQEQFVTYANKVDKPKEKFDITDETILDFNLNLDEFDKCNMTSDLKSVDLDCIDLNISALDLEPPKKCNKPEFMISEEIESKEDSSFDIKAPTEPKKPKEFNPSIFELNMDINPQSNISIDEMSNLVQNLNMELDISELDL